MLISIEKQAHYFWEESWADNVSYFKKKQDKTRCVESSHQIEYHVPWSHASCSPYMAEETYHVLRI